MSETYIVTAKTVNEAIAKANKLYADAEHEISYDILEMPKKGFLGIGAKDAMLKVTVNETKDVDLGSLVSDLKSMKLHTDRDGGERNEAQKQQSKQQAPADRPKQQSQPKQNQQQNQQQNQPKQQKPQKADNAEAKPEGKAQQNQQSNRQKQQPKPPKAEEAMPKDHAEVVVSAPVGLFDLPEKAPSTNVWGKAEPVKAAEPAKEPKEPEEPAAEAAKDAVKVAVSEEEMECALAFANTLLRNMQIDARAERGVCPEGETFETTEEATVYPRIEIVGDGSGILIGHHGETLDAIQYLVNLSAIRKSAKANSHGDYVKIVVDVENYRTKREETLRALARRMAARAVKTKHNVFLEPMNAYERRIIHSELQGFADVSTHSVGTDKNRKIIITYEGADKQPSGNRRRPQKAKSDGQRGDNKQSDKQDRSPKSAAKPAGDRPRPKKPRKMPIEKLPDFLAASSTEPNEVLGMED